MWVITNRRTSYQAHDLAPSSTYGVSANEGGLASMTGHLSQSLHQARTGKRETRGFVPDVPAYRLRGPKGQKGNKRVRPECPYHALPEIVG